MGNTANEYGFLTLTNDSITISSREGWKSLAIYCDDASTSSGTVTSSSSKTVGGAAQNGISIPAGKSSSIGDGVNDIGGVTIAAPSGCTLYIQSLTNSPYIG
jgi:hypothetical protein